MRDVEGGGATAGAQHGTLQQPDPPQRDTPKKKNIPGHQDIKKKPVLIMKKFGIVPALCLLTLACSKKSDPEAPYQPPGNFITATISGGYWNATEITRTAGGGDTVMLTGIRNPTNHVTSIQVILYQYHGTGSYTLNDTANAAIYTENGNVFHATSGSMTVGTDDITRVAANFQFTATDTNGVIKTVSNGQLNINK